MKGRDFSPVEYATQKQLDMRLKTHYDNKRNLQPGRLMPPTEPTEFQRKVLTYVMNAANRMASAREVAACAFPERWANRTGRGALVGHVAKAGDALVSMGLLACVLGPKDHWGSPKLCGSFNAKN